MTPSITSTSAAHNQPDLEKLLYSQREAFRAEGPPSLETRIDRLNRLLHGLSSHADQLAGALSDDFGQRDPVQSLATDVLATISVIRHTRRHVSKWMKTDKRTSAALAVMGARAAIQWEPLGVIGVIAPWNFPVTLSLQPAAQALAAGNRVMIKPSELTPATSEVLRQLVESHFALEEAVVVTGDAEIAESFSRLKFDHIFFTGGSSVGAKVMRAAAELLVPVTLELGGKCPVIAGSDAKISRVAGAMAFGKTLNAGQFCVAPDYLFVPDGTEGLLIRAMKSDVEKVFAKATPLPTSIINDRHFRRLQHYLSDAREKGATVVPLMDGMDEAASRLMPPTLVLDTNDSMEIAHEEIFGPILSVFTYRDIEPVVDYINQRPQPLAAYWFGGDTESRRKFLSRVSAGGVTVNDIMWHVGVESLPFGGVGHSGMGTYHGRAGFETFSHGKPVVTVARRGGTRMAVRPYPAKLESLLKSVIARSMPKSKGRS